MISFIKFWTSIKLIYNRLEITPVYHWLIRAFCYLTDIVIERKEMNCSSCELNIHF